jgi:hypothetical protein
MELDGIPLHPLVNDSAVALVPLSALVVCAFALLPSWRWLTRWGALLLTVGGAVSLALTVWTGSDLLDELLPNIPTDQPLYDQLQTHQDRAGMLLVAFLVFTVVVVVSFFLLPAPSHLDTGRLGSRGSAAGWVVRVLPAVLVVLAAVCLVLVALTGHAGAQAVFGQ